MGVRGWVVASALFGVGLLVGLLSPSLKAQAAADSSAAPWVVLEGPERPSAAGSGLLSGGWHAVKYNRCTGEAHVFSTRSHAISDKDVWFKLPVK